MSTGPEFYLSRSQFESADDLEVARGALESATSEVQAELLELMGTDPNAYYQRIGELMMSPPESPES